MLPRFVLPSGQHRWRPILSFVAVAIAVLSVLPVSSHAADSGSGAISGIVSNVATGDSLEGAQVAIPALGVSALTDNTGRYVLNGVPAGSHELVASYTGLDTARAQVQVAAGQRLAQNFDLTTGVYKLEAFTVAGEREGGAAAVTAQRNAANVKNVVAMDSYGNLPNMSASELAVLLPGVAGEMNLEGGVDGFSVRGMGPRMNSITIDGALMSTQGAMNRQPRINNLTGAMFEGLELIKGHTPDKGADSLGGTINLKSRSPLSMKEKRRVTYNFAARWAPPFFEHTPMREQHRVHPLLNVGYWEVFDVAGGDRNLGVAVNTFYSENVTGTYGSYRDYQDTTGFPAFLWDYETFDQFNNRKQASLNLKTDYRLSPNTKLTLNTVYNDANEMGKLRFTARAFTNQNVGTTGTAGILPGWTDRVTQVRQSTASNLDVSTIGPNNFFLRMRHIDFGAEHDFGPVKLDYNALFSRTHINNGHGNEGGSFAMRLNNIGWILDRTGSDEHPQFIQTGGADYTNPNNYRLNGFFQNNNIDNDHEVREVRGNLKYELPTRFQMALKTGAQWREQKAKDNNRNRRWRYLGTTLPSDPTVTTTDNRETGRQVPYWYASQFFRDRNPIQPELWEEDLYWGRQISYTGTREVTEAVTAGYVMTQGKVGATGFLAGVRVEKTDTESWGWVRARTATTNAERAADPIGAADRDYAGTKRELAGSYTKSFPSVHLSHDIAPNLKARASWSTSFGRPQMNSLLPNETANETNQTLRVNNPSLLPQTAKNWDASLEYYFEPAGSFAVNWFHKTIKDYIVDNIEWGRVGTGTDNGFNGEYPGFTLLTSSNAGTAVAQGWEFNYYQQFTFLPGLLKGFSLAANFTMLKAAGDFGGMSRLDTPDVEGFTPRLGNVSLFWRHRGFSSRVIVNYTGEYITSYSATSPARNRYLFARTIVNAGIAYQFRPWLTASLDVNNLFNEPQSAYRGYRHQLETLLQTGSTVTFGVNGRF